jgi:hypothetical protein
VRLDDQPNRSHPTPAARRPLVEVVVVFTSRGDQVSVASDHLVPRLLGHRPDGLDPAVADRDVTGPPRTA